MSDLPPELLPGAAILTAAEFEDAVTPVVPKLRANARRLTGNPVDSEDLVQDTLLRAWRARECSSRARTSTHGCSASSAIGS